jgi:hypothetical protein
VESKPCERAKSWSAICQSLAKYCVAHCWSARSNIPKIARNARVEGHRVFVLTVSYAGGCTRQISVRRERVAAEVRRWLDNYQKLKETIETICEINHDLLRPEKTRGKAQGEEP